MACFVAPAQRIVVVGLDLNFLRLMVLAGWTRLVLRGEIGAFRWCRLDVLLVTWAASSTIAYTVLTGSVEAFINRMGMSYDAVGMYVLFRCLIRDWDDATTAVYGFMLVSVPILLCFAIEHASGYNVFAFLGGVPAITVIREGRLRCQGAFAHPILAGCFCASMTPLFVAQWWRARRMSLALGASVFSSLAIIVLCASGTPVTAVGFGLVGAAMFWLRFHMKWICAIAVGVTVGLHMVMKAPVWHLVSRLDVVSGNTSWHRYQVIDQAIKHFDEWWLVGSASISHWGVHAGDITNQYVLEGVTGGAVTLVLFLSIIFAAFGMVGRMWRVFQRDPYRLAFSWALGVSLFIHCTSYLAVTYFGQMIMVWYLHLAMIASLSCASDRRRAPRVRLSTQEVTVVRGLSSNSGVAAPAS
ncbi:MAG TPA: hypothetical protein PKY77_16035 [Phycisphaerae bacterium]|nr:hypothetical protein [Phycisphaerae bacterium]HRY70128.1 hypothetical protein [Phycisphaerae bacterium]HSA28268.1 hypothetical protein [Phycisphaerae bacterium]